MVEKQFTFLKDTVAPNIKTPIVFNNETMSIGEVLDKLNELSEENEQLRKENDMFSCELSVSANKEISRNCRIAELEEENEQLKQQKEVWKQICCTNSNFNSILLHELDIAREQGFEVSNPFKQFLEDRGDVE